MRRREGIRANWLALVVLAASVAVAFGALFYSFSVLITERAAGQRFSTSVLSAAYGGFVLASGALAYRVGRFVDRSGVRPALILGGVLGAGGLAGFSVAGSTWELLGAAWLLMGPAGALLFYEPAFVTVDQWFGAPTRGKAIALLTLIGGIAGPVFLPLSSALVDALEWRPAARVLGLAVIVASWSAALAMPLHAGRPDDGRERLRLRTLVRDPRFMYFTGSVILAYGAMQAVFFHRIAVFEAAGFSVGVTAAWGGVASFLSLPGRYVAPRLGERYGPARLYGALGVVLGASVVLMILATTSGHMIAHFVAFGIAFGAFLPLRALIMGEWYSGPEYGAILGAQWSAAALAGAAVPWIVGLLRDAFDSYDPPMWIVGSLLFASSLAAAAAGSLPSSSSSRNGAKR